ncbi:S8 family peptidase [Actinoplanes sp. NPDC051475]|uniref:S8 family peptidase n=1 Tax=Actinoplanes sp. NPDC051475 TaxID=3157225 RepID=UPI00344C73EB
MAFAEGGHRSRLIGDLNRSPADGPDEPVPVLLELNVLYPGGLQVVTEAFADLWDDRTPEPSKVTAKLFQCVLTRAQLHEIMTADRRAAVAADRPVIVFKAWPDYPLYPQIDRSAPTVKADAAWRSYNARGRGVVWAVADSGIDACHPHFAALELATDPRTGKTAGLHRDFTALVRLPGDPAPDPESPLTDAQGHGTHVAGIIAGGTPPGRVAHVAASEEPLDGGYVQRQRVGTLCGMAPDCELVSLKVLRRTELGTFVTSSAAVIRALEYLRTEVNADPAVLRVHGVNISLGCSWDPEHYAAGQSPLSRAVNQLADAGALVVISSGNGGGGVGSRADSTALLGTITEPAHADRCIAVGSTHREAPHAFGVSWTSGKGPTLDGRLKPDVVAPGEWITSAATGLVRSRAGLDDLPADDPERLLTYAEQSGTSMAAPHVSGVLAAFLSARPEFIGRPREVKQLLMATATDLGRERYAQGSGVVDLMRMLADA